MSNIHNVHIILRVSSAENKITAMMNWYGGISTIYAINERTWLRYTTTKQFIEEHGKPF